MPSNVGYPPRICLFGKGDYCERSLEGNVADAMVPEEQSQCLLPRFELAGVSLTIEVFDRCVLEGTPYLVEIVLPLSSFLDVTEGKALLGGW